MLLYLHAFQHQVLQVVLIQPNKYKYLETQLQGYHVHMEAEFLDTLQLMEKVVWVVMADKVQIVAPVQLLELHALLAIRIVDVVIVILIV